VIMIDKIKGRKIPLYLEELEAKELGLLIEEDKIADDESERFVNRLKESLRKFRADKKAATLTLLAALVLFAGGWGLSALISQDVPFIQGGAPGNEPVNIDEAQGLQPVVFALDAFFLPLIKGGKESGKFLTVKAELILSDDRIFREVERALPLIRQNIYAILKRKKLSDFLNHRKPIEEKIKREIIASTNTTLISGVGSIKDVSFSQFVVK